MDIYDCSEAYAKGVRQLYPHIEFETLKYFFVSIHAWHLFDEKIISLQQYIKMCFDLALLSPRRLFYYLDLSYAKWPCKIHFEFNDDFV